jgi:hypothetical protein
MSTATSTRALGAARATTTRNTAPRATTTRRARARVDRVEVLARAESVDSDGANGANDGERGAVDGRDAEYYKGFVTEPVAVDLEERDIWTPTINLVTRSAVVLAGLFAAFLWSNGLPPFAG